MAVFILRLILRRQEPGTPYLREPDPLVTVRREGSAPLGRRARERIGTIFKRASSGDLEYLCVPVPRKIIPANKNNHLILPALCHF